MRRDVLPALCLLLLTLAVPGLAQAAEPAAALCQLSTLPQDVQRALGRYFQSWKVQEPATLAPEMATRWQAEAASSCPGIMSGHLESRRRTDYVLLLIDPASGGYRLVAFREQTAGMYGFKVLELGSSGAPNRFLRPLSPSMRAGASLAPDKEGVVVVSNDGRSLSATFYFWDKEEFMRQQVPYP